MQNADLGYIPHNKNPDKVCVLLQVEPLDPDYHKAINSIAQSLRAMQQANETFEKPANYSGINMLVELDSLQELDVKDSTIKVFRIFDFSY